jgi:hypothetical protein
MPAAFLWLRRFYGFAVSMPAAFLWLRRFNAFGVSMASPFKGFTVSMFHV